MKEIIRVKSIYIENIKNVDSGMIKFQDYDEEETIGDIVGIYGQNGSGKTTIVDAFRIVQTLLGGQRYVNFQEMLQINKLYFQITVDFYIKTTKNIEYDVTYSCKYLAVHSMEESLIYKVLNSDEKSKVIINDESLEKNEVFSPKDRNKDFGLDHQDILIKYLTQRQITKKNLFSSFIFEKSFIDTIINNLRDPHFKNVISILSSYARYNVFVVENKRNSAVSTNLILPMNLGVKNKEGEDIVIDNLFSAGINNCNESTMKQIKTAIKSINHVMSVIIPDFSIKIKEIAKSKDILGYYQYTYQLISKRELSEFPLSYESDGIKKILSYIGSLIHMYNRENILVVIDEFDSGVYEYLIGEILQVLSEGGQGQFLFTSHNLRPLEILNSKCIWFSTTNPMNRYIQFKNLKPNNNLRDSYYRAIKLGGQKEEIYKKTDQFKIRNAFYACEDCGDE